MKTVISIGSVITLLAGVNALGQSLNCDLVPSGLIHWLKFEGNYRDAWSAADFVVSRMRFVPGHHGLGLKSCACNPPAVQTDLLLSNSWTWVGWLKWDGPDQLRPQWAYTFAALGGPTKDDDDIHMYVLGSADPEWFQGDTPGNLRVTFHGRTWNVTGVPMPVGDWVHVAVVYHSEDGSLELYMNGNLMRVLPAGRPRDPSKRAVMFIGNSRADQHFNGVIDEVLLFARALEPSEIQRLYQLPKTYIITIEGTTNPTGQWNTVSRQLIEKPIEDLQLYRARIE